MTDLQTAAVICFCAGFVLSGIIAGWAGMWKRPTKNAYVCSSCNAVSAAERPPREPVWYDFLFTYPVLSWLDGKTWQGFWLALAGPFRSGAALCLVPVLILAYTVRSCQADNDAAMSVAKSWCARRGCDALKCSHTDGDSSVFCQIRFPGQRVETRDCRGHECSPK